MGNPPDTPDVDRGESDATGLTSSPCTSWDIIGDASETAFHLRWLSERS
jgi:hypothetical protein